VTTSNNVWFTSDLHIGHGLVAESRGYDDITEHDDRLAAEWDSAVGPRDQVWVLGDISAGGSGAQRQALAWIAQRRGRKHLVPGNHDGCHPMYRDAHRWQPEYLEVFGSVQAYARRRIAGQTVLLSHFPYIGDHTTEDRFTRYRLLDDGAWLLHGHTHSVLFSDGDHPRQIHIGVDAWRQMRPMHLDDVAQLITEEAP